MRLGLASFWLIAALLTAGPAHAGTRLTAGLIDRIGIVAIMGSAGTPTVVSAARGSLVIETHSALPADTSTTLRSLSKLITGAAVSGSRLRLALAPGVISTSSPVAGGTLSISLEQVGADAPPSRHAEPVAAASAPPTTQAPPRIVPRPQARPETVAAAPALPAPAPEPAAAPPAPPPIPDHLEVTGSVARGTAELAFAWPAPVRAAVFTRAGVLWAAFDAEQRETRGLEQLQTGDLAAWLEPLPSASVDGAELFRFRLRREVRVEAVQEDRTWRIRLSPPGPDDAPVGLTRDQKAGTLRGSAPARGLDLTDPDTGERLGALMAAGGRLRQPAAVRLVDLELLPAAQGLAWLPLADGISVAADAAGFTLTRDGGLRLSAPADPHAAAAPEVAAAPPALPTALLGLPALAATDPAGRQRDRLALAARIAGLEPLPQALARLDQVRLLLADGLGPEARATLERPLPGGLPAEARATIEPSRTVMAAAAAALEGQHGRALGRLLEPALDGDREVALWRAYAAAGAGQHALAGREWRRGGAVLADYPMPLRMTLGLEIGASLAQNGSPQQARELQDLLRPVATDTGRARLDLLRGVAATRTEQPVLAEQTLRAAAANGDADTRTRAEFLLTMSRHDQGALDAAKTAEALAAQRPNWRGHPWEARMLRQLGDLEMQAGDTFASFATTLEAARRPGDPAAAEGAAADLRRRLKEVIHAADAGTVSPVAAVALHGSYGELLDGDPEVPALRRRLAGLAAAAGLDESAAALTARAGANAPNPASALADRQRLDTAARAGDWPAVAVAARAILDRHPDDAPLAEEDAAAVVWLALAHARTGAAAEAGSVGEEYGSRLPEGRWQALLGLVTGAAAEPGRGQAAPDAAAALVKAVRDRLDQLAAPGGA